jgi:hypothetical protein
MVKAVTEYETGFNGPRHLLYCRFVAIESLNKVLCKIRTMATINWVVSCTLDSTMHVNKENIGAYRFGLLSYVS